MRDSEGERGERGERRERTRERKVIDERGGKIVDKSVEKRVKRDKNGKKERERETK
jgi:hypothetical protein